MQGRFDDAFDTYSRGTEPGLPNPSALLGLALILARAAAWQPALEAVRQAEKMWPDNASARKLTERIERRNLP